MAKAPKDENNGQNFNKEGIYKKASLALRFWASVLDSMILTGLTAPAVFLFLGVRKYYFIYDRSSEIFIIVLIAFLYLIPLTYAFIKDGLGNGQSWGKKALGLMVIHLPTNTPCSSKQSIKRELIKLLLNLIPLIGGFMEPIKVISSKDGRRYGDIAANTQVIEARFYNL